MHTIPTMVTRHTSFDVMSDALDGYGCISQWIPLYIFHYALYPTMYLAEETAPHGSKLRQWASASLTCAV